MRMELALSDEQAVRLSRCKRLAGVPVARRSARGDFYDTADGQAAQAGLTLEKRGRAWRIGQRSTSAPPWLPIEPTPPVSRLPFEPTGPLGVVASWRGRDAVFSVGSVTLTVRRGSVDGRSIARALFDGPDADVLSLLLDLAEDCAFAIPTLSWANEIWGDGSLAAPTLGSHVAEANAGSPFVAAAARAVEVLGRDSQAFVDGDDDPEHVHRMRVAIRRVRAAIATVSSNNADVAATDDGLKTWAKALGPARDWDVFALETLPPILEAFPKNRPMVRLAKAVADTRSDENAALRTTLGDPIYRQTMLRLAWLCGAMVWLPTPTDSDEADTAGRRILRRRWKKLAAFLRIADELDTVGLHEMRLRAKRARYTMELFRSLGSAKDADRAIQRLTRLQDRLGAYNDLDTAARLLSAFGTRHGHARGVVLGFLAARALTMRPEIVRSSRKLRKAHKFWV